MKRKVAIPAGRPAAATWTMVACLSLSGCLGRSELALEDSEEAVTLGHQFECLAQGEWSDASQLLRARAGGVVVPLLKGGAIYAGGSGDSQLVDYVERYDEKNNHWKAEATLAKPRDRFQGTLLQDGRVLFTGGRTGLTGEEGVDLAEIYDPVKHKVVSAARMPEARFSHSAALMHDGRVLVVGGFRGEVAASTAVLYDPEDEDWREIDAPPSVRGGQVAIVPHERGAWILTSKGVYAFDGYDFEVMSDLSSRARFEAPLATDRHSGFVSIDGRGNVWELGPNGLRSKRLWSGSDRVIAPSAVLSLCEDVFLFADRRYRVSFSKDGPVIVARDPLEAEGVVGARLVSGALLVVGGWQNGTTTKFAQVFR